MVLKKVKRKKAVLVLTQLISSINILELPVDDGVQYGQIGSSLEKKGQIIGNNDLWIAAHALASGLILVTNNVREFARIDNLTIENWAA